MKMIADLALELALFACLLWISVGFNLFNAFLKFWFLPMVLILVYGSLIGTSDL